MRLMHSAVVGILTLVFLSPLFAQSNTRTMGTILQAAVTSSCDWKESEPTAVRSPIQMDIHAGYRTFVFSSDGTIGFRVHGEYPHAAFMSLAVYDNGRVYSVRSDYQIEADGGSLNPFLSGNLVRTPNRSFTITILPAGVEGISGPNIMYMPLPPGSNQKKVAIEERIYLAEPDKGRFGGDAPTLEPFDVSNPGLPITCPLRDDSVDTSESSNFGSTLDQAPLPQDGIIQFYRPPSSLVPFADSSNAVGIHDCTSYLMATVFPDQLAVVRVPKVPEFFDNTTVNDMTLFPEPYDGVRYVSFGAYGASVLSVAQNENVAGPGIVKLPDGSATFVAIPISMKNPDAQNVEQKARQLGYNVMPLAEYGPLIAGDSNGPQINPFLIYRNKVPSKGFAGDIKNVGCFHGGKFSKAPSPAFAASPKNMGEYAPIGVECSVSAFLQDGCGQEFHYPRPR